MRGAIGSANIEAVGALAGSLRIARFKLNDDTLAERWLRAGANDRLRIEKEETNRVAYLDRGLSVSKAETSCPACGRRFVPRRYYWRGPGEFQIYCSISCSRRNLSEWKNDRRSLL